MINYDSYEYIEFDWINRFPEEAEGLTLWRTFLSEPISEFPRPEQRPMQITTPRVFVSYKSQNREYALRIAYLSNEEGFNYWLDVLDPVLKRVTQQHSVLTPEQKAFAIAAIIEMALLNSSHVIASITPLTWDSRWVPYEFGRIKDDFVLAHQASSWIAPNQQTNLPEYLNLCPQSFSESDIRSWLKNERNIWENKNGIKLPRPATKWTLPIPPQLP